VHIHVHLTQKRVRGRGHISPERFLLCTLFFALYGDPINVSDRRYHLLIRERYDEMDTTVALNFFWESFWIDWWMRHDAAPREAALLHLFLIRRARDPGFAAYSAAEGFSDVQAKDALRTALAGALGGDASGLAGAGRDAYLWRRYLDFLDAGDLPSARLVETMLCTAAEEGYLAPPVAAGEGVSRPLWERMEKRLVMSEIRYPDLYFEAPYLRDLSGAQISPADLEITSFAVETLKNLLGGTVPPGDAGAFERFINDAGLIIAFSWFAAKPYDEQAAVLNAVYPFSLGEETLDQFVAIFDDYETLLEEAAGLVKRGFAEEAKTVYAYTILHADGAALHHACYENLAVLFREEGEYARAGDCAERALAIRKGMPGSDPYLVALGEKSLSEALYLQGNTGRATDLIASALAAAERLSPEKARSLLWAIASSFRRTGRFEEEYALLTRILEGEGDGEAMDAAMARLFSMDQYARADGSFDLAGLAAVEDRRRYLDFFGKGAALLQAFQFDRAIACFGEALAISRDADLLRNIAIAHRLYGSVRTAAEYFGMVLRDRPADVFSLIHLGLLTGGEEGGRLIGRGVAAALEGRMDLALVLYPIVRDAVPGGAVLDAIDRSGDLPAQGGGRALYYLGAGTILADLGFSGEAETCYRRALKANPQSRVRARVLRNMGALAADAGDQKHADSLLEQALRYAPGDPTVWHRLAGVGAALGDLSGAAAAAREAVRLAPAEPEYGRERDLRAAKEEAAPPAVEDPVAAELIAAGERLIERDTCAKRALSAYTEGLRRVEGLDEVSLTGGSYAVALSERSRLFALFSRP
jgi:tetratricopeptide (TPR) repeat protein